jgi:hypothetical protein
MRWGGQLALIAEERPATPEHRSADPAPEAPEPPGKMDALQEYERAPRPHAKARRPGRPKGTNYWQVDAPLHELMRQLLTHGKVASLTAAAREVVDRAYGKSTTEESKITRLVRTYPYPYLS